MYDKRKFNKVNNKKVLHKVKKQWVTISIALLMMIGVGAMATHTTHAASTPISVTTTERNSQPASNNIQKDAVKLHKTLLTRAAKSTNNNTQPSSTQANNINNKNNSSANNNTLMTYKASDFKWNGNPYDSFDITSDQSMGNNSLISLASKTASYSNASSDIDASASDVINNISDLASSMNQSISDKLSDSSISSSQANLMSQSVARSANSERASENSVTSSMESTYNNLSSARNSLYASLRTSTASSHYYNYLSLITNRNVNPTFKDASIISSSTNYSPAEKQYILNIHNQLSDLNKQNDQLNNILRKDNISDMSMFNENGGPSVTKKNLITDHPDAISSYRNLEINWVNFYRKMYNLPEVHESSRLDTAAQQYAERGSDPDCLGSGLEGPYDDVNGYYTDADNADNNGTAGHRTAIINYESDMGVGANDGKNGFSDDTLLGGDYAGMYVGLKNYDYLKPYRNGEVGMNYAISYPKPGLFSYSDAKRAQQWSLWVPALNGYTTEADAMNSKYQPLGNSDSYLKYFGKDTKVAVHDDTTNQDVNVSNITLASDYGDADYLCYVVDDKAIQLNHTYTITVSNIHNWQSHTFKYTTKLYDPDMYSPKPNINSDQSDSDTIPSDNQPSDQSNSVSSSVSSVSSNASLASSTSTWSENISQSSSTSFIIDSFTSSSDDTNPYSNTASDMPGYDGGGTNVNSYNDLSSTSDTWSDNALQSNSNSDYLMSSSDTNPYSDISSQSDEFGYNGGGTDVNSYSDLDNTESVWLDNHSSDNVLQSNSNSDYLMSSSDNTNPYSDVSYQSDEPGYDGGDIYTNSYSDTNYNISPSDISSTANSNNNAGLAWSDYSDMNSIYDNIPQSNSDSDSLNSLSSNDVSDPYNYDFDSSSNNTSDINTFNWSDVSNTNPYNFSDDATGSVDYGNNGAYSSDMNSINPYTFSDNNSSDVGNNYSYDFNVTTNNSSYSDINNNSDTSYDNTGMNWSDFNNNSTPGNYSDINWN